MQKRRPIRNRKPSEEGFMMLVAIFMLALLVLSLSVAVPQITKQIQRDREVETKQRGKQYQRAIQLYYRKFGSYPPNINALVQTNNIRFLRKRYTDPMTGVDDWKPILFGQNKAPMVLGFFGEPLTGATALAGVGPSGGNGAAGVPGMGNTTSSGFGSSFGSGTSGSSLFDSSTFGGSNANAAGSTAGATGAAGGTSATDGSNSGTGSASGSGSASGTSSGGSTSSGLSSLSGQTFGGGGIIGFEPGHAGRSILLYKKMDQYNEWEFTYSPLMEMKTVGSSATGASGLPTGVNQNGTGFGGTTTGGLGTTGSGLSTGTTGFGGTGFDSSGTGTGTSPVTAPQPQQSQ